MDRNTYSHGRSNPPSHNTIPPWRTPRQPPQTQNVSYRQVDSWRSYKTDATNLQTSTQSHLNAMAPSFQPSPRAQPTHYTPYQPLRVSNGSAERTIVEAANTTRAKPKKEKKNKNAAQANTEKSSVPSLPARTTVQTQLAFASRYPVRTNHGQASADQAIPSIEKPSGQSAPSLTFRKIVPQRRSKTSSPDAPETTAAYRAQAQQEPTRSTHPRRLLVVLDLNGTLLYRTRNHAGAKVYMRPGVTPFLDYLFTNHTVMVYTSAMPQTAIGMVNQFLHPKYRNQLAAVWARDKLDLTPEQFVNKVQVYKKLDKIWSDEAVQQTAGAGNRWDQSNTILVDDSKLKALAQPHNLLQVTEYTAKDDPTKYPGAHKAMYKAQQEIIQQLQMKLEALKYQEDVSRMIRKWQRGEVEVPRMPGQEQVVEETVDQKEVKQEQPAPVKEIQHKSHLLTPSSSRDGDSVERPVHPSDDEDTRGAPLSPVSSRASSHVSSVDENVFRELLEGTGQA